MKTGWPSTFLERTGGRLKVRRFCRSLNGLNAGSAGGATTAALKGVEVHAAAVRFVGDHREDEETGAM